MLTLSAFSSSQKNLERISLPLQIGISGKIISKLCPNLILVMLNLKFFQKLLRISSALFLNNLHRKISSWENLKRWKLFSAKNRSNILKRSERRKTECFQVEYKRPFILVTNITDLSSFIFGKTTREIFKSFIWRHGVIVLT